MIDGLHKHLDTPLCEATPSQIAAHRARKERLARLTPKPICQPLIKAEVRRDYLFLSSNSPGAQRAQVRVAAPPSSREIVAACSAEFGIGVHDLLGRRRKRLFCRARFAAFWLLERYGASGRRLSLPQIGNRVGGRDHTTVLYALRQVEGFFQRNEEADFVSALRRIVNRLGLNSFGEGASS